MTLIDGDRIVTVQLYDDEHEEFIEKKMSIIDCLNAYTDEGVTEADVVNQTRWIPVSEGLPEDGQSVLFCDIDNDIMIGYHVKGRPGTHFSQDGTYEDIKDVRAWMPLPEAYKGGGKK